MQQQQQQRQRQRRISTSKTTPKGKACSPWSASNVFCLACVLVLVPTTKTTTHGLVPISTATPRVINQRSAKVLLPQRPITTALDASNSDNNDDNDNNKNPTWTTNKITEDPKRSILFSLLMIASGAILGPFLDSYHSAFGVLQYDDPIQWIGWGSSLDYPALTTTWWVPELFGLAGFLIGWLYILLDDVLLDNDNDTSTNWFYQSPSSLLNPSPPKILVGISFFTLQYWLSGILVQAGVDRTTLLNGMSLLAALGFLGLESATSTSGLIVSAATAVGGPLIEAGLLWASRWNLLNGGGYHYNDLGETGFFPLWIVPVYFLGGPANGNLARGYWNLLTTTTTTTTKDDMTATTKSITTREEEEEEEAEEPCPNCQDTRRSPCPNCDGVGTYVAMGGITTTCTSCSGRGYVMCRVCFGRYDGDDPWDIEGIRETMRRMPD